MEREILFRGKRVDSGEWLESGSINQVYYNAVYLAHGVSWEQVLSSTIGRYTGLTDKNGKKIFEGDIIIEINATDIDRIPRKVIWVNLTFKCPYIKHHGAYGNNCVELDFLYSLKRGNMKVVGNIHDNPELLEKEKNKLYRLFDEPNKMEEKNDSRQA